MQTKVCTKCGTEYPATNEYFNKGKNYKSGLKAWCKECCRQDYYNNIDHYSEYNKKYAAKNKEKIAKYKKEYALQNAETIAQKQRTFYRENNKKWRDYAQEHKEEIAQRMKKYRQDNRLHIQETNRNYREIHKLEIKENLKKYRLQNHELILQRAKNRRLQEPERYKAKIKKYQTSEKGKATLAINAQRREARLNCVCAKYSRKEWEDCINYFSNKCCYCGKEERLTQDHFKPLKNGGEYTPNNIVPACLTCNCSKHTSDFFEWYPKQTFYSKKRERKILKYLNYDSKTQYQQLAL